jgi:MtN3 and saliva related transmembrane protein
MIQLLGFLAGTLTTVAFVPQVVRTWRTRSANDLSLAMLIVFALGVTLWLAYGVAISSSPVILANAVTLVLTLVLVAFKCMF